MSDLTQRITQLSLEDRIRLEERLLAARKNGHTQRVQRRTGNGPVSLSFTQERLWFLAQLEPDSAAYNETSVTRLTGPLNIFALERSLDKLVARHDSLRVCFQEIDGEVCQVDGSLPPVHLSTIDLSDIDADIQMAAVWERVYAIRDELFDLTRPPLWRVVLLRLAEDDHIFVYTTHHIISDGWSNSIFWRELRHFYAAFVENKQPQALLELPLSYADFSVWQREWLAGERLEQLAAYWVSRLDGIKPLDIHTDYPRPTRPSHRGALLHFHLPPALSASLNRLARAKGASLYMLLLAAFQVLLHRYSGQDDIVVGSPAANRNRSEFEGIYGFFANTLVMRSDCTGNPSFDSLLTQVRQNALAAYAHQDLPFEKLVKVLRPVRDMSRSPVFDVLFALQNAPHSDVGLAGITTQRLEQTTTNSKFDLSLFLYEREVGLEGRVEYATDLFQPSTIQRMIGHFQILLEGIVASPDSPIDELPLLRASEREQILVAWNPPTTDYPSAKTIQQLFQEQAACTPKAVAIVDGEERLTYQQLDECANRLAHYLLATGVEPGDRIGLPAERSGSTILRILAILKAGAAYVPLNFTDPPARLKRIVEETGVKVILLDDEQQPHLDSTAVEYSSPGLSEEELSDYPILPPDVPATPDALAYIMYTSGSTGAPKGVAVPHRAVIRLMERPDFLEIKRQDVFLLMSALIFDASTWELWGSLLNGARLVVVAESTPALSTIAAAIRQHRVSVLWLTAALFHLMVDEYPDALAQVRCLLAGGDILDPVRVRSTIAQRPPGGLLINGYGPTENTTFSCCYPMNNPAQIGTTVPIGRPIRGSTAYILDGQMQPVPIGVPGELYVGGAGLALGYHHRPDLTAERFVPHPFADEPDARLYRTGDLARYREDGVIEFLGRVDRQVKIRGFRVEPGEIETVLSEHPAVRDGVVGVQTDEVLGKRLIAWWIGRPGAEADAGSLRDFLRQRLPDYMLPAAFVQVNSFPLTPNGKIDLSQLPTPEIESRSVPSQAPQTPLERQLYAIWQQVLGNRNLGIDDNFFDAGGHSLLAVRLVARVIKATGQELPVSSLFYGPTIREQAALLEKKGWSPPWTSLVPVQPAGTRPPLFLVPPAASTGLRFAKLAHFLGPDQPIYGFDPGGLDDRTELHTTVEEMAAHFVGEMRQLQPHGPYLVGGMCFGGHVAYEMAQQLGEDAPVLLLMDVGQPANGPTWSIPPRNLLYDLRRFLEYRQEGHHWKAARVQLYSRWKRFWQRIRHWYDPDLQRMGRVYGMQLPAMRNYVAHPIHAKLILFQSDEPMVHSRQRGWHELSKSFEVIHFPNTTHRSLLLEDENIERIAEKLRDMIDRWMGEYGRDRTS
ncbi:MAG: amino acid adenylation domain-containing protein [Caldilineaceae bacterium]|nr:amino acid adenylation domain-containing protein [Caldilineaceae bacterium]